MSKLRPTCLLLFCMLASCGSVRGPQAVFEAYLQALAAGKPKQAFMLLSSQSRAALAHRERKLLETAETGKMAPPQAARLAFLKRERKAGSPPGLALFQFRLGGVSGRAWPPFPAGMEQVVQSVRLEGSQATLEVDTPLGRRTARLVLEKRHWRVLLTF